MRTELGVLIVAVTAAVGAQVPRSSPCLSAGRVAMDCIRRRSKLLTCIFDTRQK
jgi:hypothetical protein